MRIFRGYTFRKCLVVLIVLTFFFTSQVYGQGEPIKDQKEGDISVTEKGKFRDMKLTPEQSEVLKKIRDKYESKREDILFQMKEKKLEIIRLLKEDKPNRKKIEKKLEEISKLEGERQRLFLDEFFEVREVLNPEQVEIFTRKTIRFLLRN